MAAIERMSHLMGITLSTFSKEEILALEAELFVRICEELKEDFRKQYRFYFNLMRLTKKKENKMLDNMFVCLVIKDILSTEEYNLKGVANYIDTHEDVIQEIVDGRNVNPSAILLRRTIELHRLVRPEFYRGVIKKAIEEGTQKYS